MLTTGELFTADGRAIHCGNCGKPQADMEKKKKRERKPTLIWKSELKLGVAGQYATDAQARAAFDAMDTESKGSLGTEEVRRYLEEQGYGGNEADTFLKRIDLNARGRIDFEEFKQGWAFINTFSIGSRTGEEVIRKPDSIRGIDIVVEDCTSSTVAICDHVSQAQLDNLNKCKILVGPCAGSVFLRDCVDCTFSIATRQLRTRNCTNCTVYLFSQTEPIIETSSGMRFAPYNASYPEQAKHFEKAGLDPALNLFYAIYDFNGAEADAATHWSELPDDAWEAWVIPLPEDDLGQACNPVDRRTRAPIPENSMRGKDITNPSNFTDSQLTPRTQSALTQARSKMCVLL